MELFNFDPLKIVAIIIKQSENAGEWFPSRMIFKIHCFTSLMTLKKRIRKCKSYWEAFKMEFQILNCCFSICRINQFPSATPSLFVQRKQKHSSCIVLEAQSTQIGENILRWISLLLFCATSLRKGIVGGV